MIKHDKSSRLAPLRWVLPLTALGVVFLCGLPQIGNGGFESPTSGSANVLVPSWSLSTAGSQVLDASLVGADVGMPAEGVRWLTVSAAGSFAALPPTNPGGFGTAARMAVGVSQTFRLTGSATSLSVSAVFLSNEPPGTPWEDFLSVDVSDGASALNLIYLNTNSPLPATSSLWFQSIGGAMPASSVVTAIVDLPALYPSADTNTVFTLTLSVGNRLDGSLPSRGYFDDVRLGTGTPIPTGVLPTQAWIELLSTGDWLLRCQAGAWPGGQVYNVFSADTAGPVGTGPLLGLYPDHVSYDTLWQPLGTHPFHVGLDANGLYAFTIPAWVAPGITADLVMIVIYAGTVVEVSPVVRHTF